MKLSRMKAKQLLTTLLLTALFASCESSNAQETFTVKTYTATDKNDNASEDYSIDWPISGPNKLVSSIREWILSELNDTVLVNDTTDGFSVVSAYEKHALRRLESSHSDFIDEDEIPSFSETFNISMIANTSRYVTFEKNIEGFYGGTITPSGVSGASFDKSTGEPIIIYIPRSKVAGIQPLLRKYVARELGMTQRELQQQVRRIALPETDLYYDKSGVKFVYQPYELLFNGVISFTIPMAEVKPFIMEKR